MSPTIGVLDVVALVVAAVGVGFAVWGLVDTVLDRRAVIASGVNGLRREAALERLIASWLVLAGQVVLGVCLYLVIERHTDTRGDVTVAALALVCAIFTLKTLMRRRSRTRMRALYAAGHR